MKRAQPDEDDRLTERFADSLTARRQRAEARMAKRKTTASHPTCAVHPHVLLRCPACAGAKGGQSTSPKKRRAVRRNLKLAREEANR